MVPFWWSGVEQGFAVLFMQHGTYLIIPPLLLSLSLIHALSHVFLIRTTGAGLASLRRAGIALVLCGLAGQWWGVANYLLEEYQLYWWISSDVWGLTFFLIAWYEEHSHGSSIIDFPLSHIRLHTLCWNRLSPSSWFYRRPSLRGYVAFFSMFYMVKTIANVGEFLEYDEAACLFLIQDILREVMRPYFIFRTLLLDSRYWRGLFKLEDGDSKPVVSSVNSSSSSGNIRSPSHGGPPGGPHSPSVSLRQPLIGTSLISSAALTLAQQVDGLQVPMLNYAYLNLGDAERGIRLLGVGSTARVYRGQYKGRPVAIKLIFVVELTPDVIQNFAREVSTCA
jgi:hypothetical protein